MNALLTYFLESSLCLLVVGSIYLLLFRHGSYIKARRAFILVLVSASLIIPGLQISYTVDQSIAPEMAYLLQEVAIGVESLMLPEVIVNAPESSVSINWLALVVAAYVTAAALLMLYFAWQLIQIYRLKSNHPRENLSGLQIVRLSGNHPTFSFFRTIFFNPPAGITSSEKEKILSHELAHVNQMHSLDNLFIEICRIVFWFHPMVWYFKKELKNVHEYLADEHVTQHSNAEEYRSLLSRLTLENNGISLGNYFNRSQTLNRLKMLTTPKKPLSTWKIGVTTFLVALLFFTFSCQEDVLNDISAIETTMSQTEPEGIAKSALEELREKYPDFSFSYFETDAENLKRAEKLQNIDNETIAGIYVNKSGETGTIGIILSDRAGWKPRQTDAEDKAVLTMVDNPAQPKGGMESFQKYLVDNMKYPAEAERDGIEGKVFVQFVVNENGEVTDAKVVKGIGGGCDEEALRVISNQPDWNPPLQGGSPVKQRIVLPVTFKLGHSEKTQPEQSQAKKGLEVDEPAQPIGGYKVLYTELVENIKYPNAAQENNVSGKVFVQFTVSKEGTLKDIATIKGIGHGFDEEAVRVLSQSKVKWEPAVRDGQDVEQRIVLPITFAQK